MDEIEDFDLLVVGGGKAGKSLAMDRAKAGWRVAMVERDKIGGTCINVACIPTKSIVASARALQAVRGAAQFGIEIGAEPRVSLDGLRRHKEGVVGGMVDAHRGLFGDSGMDFVLGTARFVGERTVDVALTDGSTRRLRGERVLINTGTTPVVPDLPGMEAAHPWTSETILELTSLPETITILGGGHVGCEFASMLGLLGCQVTLLQGGRQLLPREDPDIAEAVQQTLTDHGVEVRLNARATAVSRQADGTVSVDLEDRTQVLSEELLVATGRAPVTSDLGLDIIGVELDSKGFVVVDDRLHTSVEGVWAAGDVAGSPQFTHVSWHDFRVLKANFTGGSASTADRLIPYAVFVTPELARVGLTETEARASYPSVRTATIGVAAIPRAKTLRETTGLWKIVLDGDTDLILGAALYGHESGEVITSVQMAMLGSLTASQVRDSVITHPTMGEGLNILLDALG